MTDKLSNVQFCIQNEELAREHIYYKIFNLIPKSLNISIVINQNNCLQCSTGTPDAQAVKS